LTGTGALDEPGYWSGTCIIDNRYGDPNINIAGVLMHTTNADAGTIVVPRAHIELRPHLSAAAGTTANHIHATGGTTGTLEIHDLTSNAVIETTGTIKGWSEHCFTYPFETLTYVAGTDDNVIPISDAFVGLRLAYGGCRCVGTCGNAEDITFEDDAGNQIGAAAVTCVDNTADMTWTDLRADADGLIPVSKSPRFDITTASNVATDDLQVCVRYSTSRFAP
jgi:hypothetical protein